MRWSAVRSAWVKRGNVRLGDFRYWLAENKGTLLAVAVFVIMFGIYTGNHSAGFSGMVVTTAANKGVLLALVAMAQTLVVLTAGIDLSVGMVFVLANCLASQLVVGSPLETTFGVVVVLAAGLACGALNGVIVVYGRLQPIVTTLATGAMFYGLALLLRPVPGGDVNSDLADALTEQWPFGIPTHPGRPAGGSCWSSGCPCGASEIGRAHLCHRLVRTGRLHVRRQHRPRAHGWPMPSPACSSACGGLMLTFITYSGEASATIGGSYTLNSIAAVVIGGVSLFGGAGSAGRFHLRRLRPAHHRRSAVRLRSRSALWQPLVRGRHPAGRREHRRGARAACQKPPGAVLMRRE